MLNFSFNTAFASALLSAAALASDESLSKDRNAFVPYKLRGVHSSTNVDDVGGTPSVPLVLEETEEDILQVKDLEKGAPHGETLRNVIQDSNISNKVSFVFDPSAELGRLETSLVADHTSADHTGEEFSGFLDDEGGYSFHSLWKGRNLQLPRKEICLNYERSGQPDHCDYVGYCYFQAVCNGNAVPCNPDSTSPTPGPTQSLTSGPTPSPTPGPTASPTPGPTQSPTPGPTPSPTASPTPGPTPSPTPAPTPSPTPGPTPSPTASPTPGPTPSPTSGPTPSPTPSPTASPTPGPTSSPTASPTPGPTPSPTASPTPGPTPSPTSGPTPSPTPGPTQSPTPGPTQSPTPGPTQSPTPGPTSSPTASPTPGPTTGPTTFLSSSRFTLGLSTCGPCDNIFPSSLGPPLQNAIVGNTDLKISEVNIVSISRDDTFCENVFCAAGVGRGLQEDIQTGVTVFIVTVEVPETVDEDDIVDSITLASEDINVAFVDVGSTLLYAALVTPSPTAAPTEAPTKAPVVSLSTKSLKSNKKSSKSSKSSKSGKSSESDSSGSTNSEKISKKSK